MTKEIQLKKANLRLISKLSLVVIGMFGFGFALVPLYEALCNITGLNGKTGQIEAAKADAYKVDTDRWVTVEFVGRVNDGLKWDFGPVVHKMKVHPGEVNKAMFFAENKTDEILSGQAVPSLVPNLASRFFNKTECFCFTRQTLSPRQRQEMPLRFVIAPDLPKDVGSVALSYTFFKIDNPVAGGMLSAEPVNEKITEKRG